MKIAIKGTYKGYPVGVERECAFDGLSQFVEQAIAAGIEKPTVEPRMVSVEATPSNSQQEKQ